MNIPTPDEQAADWLVRHDRGLDPHDIVGAGVRPVASAGFNDDYLETAQISWADVPRGHGTTGTAIREDKVPLEQRLRDGGLPGLLVGALFSITVMSLGRVSEFLYFQF